MLFFTIVCVVFGVLMMFTHQPDSESGLSAEVEALLRKDGIDPSGRRDWSQINPS